MGKRNLPNLKEKQKAFKELTELLTDEDLKNIAESSREFRKNFVLRTYIYKNPKPKKQKVGEESCVIL